MKTISQITNAELDRKISSAIGTLLNPPDEATKRMAENDLHHMSVTRANRMIRQTPRHQPKPSR